MAQTKINLNNTINCSLQVGDYAYVSNVLAGGITSEQKYIGRILDVQASYIIINTDISAIMAEYPSGISGMFLMFEKRIEANDSSLKGYYANVTFENYSNQYTELFAVGSEIALSSK